MYYKVPNRQVFDGKTYDYAPGDSVGYELADFDYNELIRRSWSLSFLIVVMYRKSKTLPSEFERAIDPDVAMQAKRCANWDMPGEDHFSDAEYRWLNKLPLEKRWIFSVHSGVYAAQGLDFSGAVKDPVTSGYDRMRASQNDPQYTHILDKSVLSLRQAYQRTHDRYEKQALRVRQDLIENLTSLQIAQSKIISSYLGEAMGNIQPDILSYAADLAREIRPDLQNRRVIEWLPQSILFAMESLAEIKQEETEVFDFYFGCAEPKERPPEEIFVLGPDRPPNPILQ